MDTETPKPQSKVNYATLRRYNCIKDQVEHLQSPIQGVQTLKANFARYDQTVSDLLENFNFLASKIDELTRKLELLGAVGMARNLAAKSLVRL
jgi:prefoldin subunit 5